MLLLGFPQHVIYFLFYHFQSTRFQFLKAIFFLSMQVFTPLVMQCLLLGFLFSDVGALNILITFV